MNFVIFLLARIKFEILQRVRMTFVNFRLASQPRLHP